MTTNSEPNEELISDDEEIQGLPGCIRVVIGLVACGVLAVSVFLMWKYVDDPQNFASPSELQLGNLVIFSLSVLALVLIPWASLGLRIRKIGAVEFDRVVSGQAKEHIEEFAEVRSRIEELEVSMRHSNEMATITEGLVAQELHPLLLKFLKETWPKAFSPLRIKKWGTHQPGYENLAQYSQAEIRISLQDMVSEERVVTRVSRLGNTLYKLAD